MGRSGKQRKAELQQKRAIKRGDAPPPPPQPRRKKFRRSPKQGHSLETREAYEEAAKAARKLQSAFLKLDPKFIEETKNLAAAIPLTRPIPVDACILADKANDRALSDSDSLSVPKRPKWKYKMTKAEVDGNEVGHFRKWISQTDTVVERWLAEPQPADANAHEEPQIQDPEIPNPPAPPTRMPRAPTHFERNLDVWRQLWRVTEISQILLCLLDSRCPPLHFPPSLASYLATRPAKIILVLTKVDIAGPTRAAAWTKYLTERHFGIPIVQVESYTEKTGEQGRSVKESYLPLPFRQRLVSALREVHSELLVPPERLRSDEAKVKRWRPPVKRDIDWEGVLKAGGGMVGSVVGGAAVPRSKDTHIEAHEGESDETEETRQEPEYLTVGLIGQPNVGKSSLLNALFGVHKVRASRTPGKTKHFQTLFWTSDVRLVDCPGLVMPSFVPMDVQVLSGILPISRVSAIPFCVHQIAQLMPLERILELRHPSIGVAPTEDKRTWRDGMRGAVPKDQREVVWSASDIMTAYADKKGWVTAKAGRPDVNRAGNAILRFVAEGKVSWAFWPPGTDLGKIEEEVGSEAGIGIWIPGGIRPEDDDEESDYPQEETGHDDESNSDEDDSEDGSDGHEENEEQGVSEDSEEGESEEEIVKSKGVGRFGALAIDDL
ncbi:P-loop containing nucleoside triphosphate hydrolase protein [Hygrophoropsis aurantiaca]|uniref:P-loop containing nucleoside triphosphate hydrolase protein n=1 Tax=Hygrophoropsis aurantiaca TaxID=72124 RepID=A0ACB8ASX6_9AGAM|nr:P-loop containing nucleoside triphosphate hydrolase protein [Hygrophoropsis aurantiaca]